MRQRSVKVTIVGTYPVPENEISEGDDFAYPPSKGSPAEIDRWEYEDKGDLTEVVSWFDKVEVTFEDVVT